MGVFNYSRFHYFDKNGHELILSHRPDVKIDIINDNIPEFYAEYAFVKSTPDNVDPATNSSLLQIKSGMRFNVNEGTTLRAHTEIKDTNINEQYINDAFLRSDAYNLEEYTSTYGNENYPSPIYNNADDDARRLVLDANNLALDTSVNFFPTYTFNTRITFDKVSTELVETQTIYVLVDDEYDVDKNGVSKFVTVAEYAKHYDEFANACEPYDSSIAVLRDKIDIVDSSISDVESILFEDISEINELTEIQNTHREELAQVSTELDNMFEATGVIDPQLSARKRELDEQIESIDSSINSIYNSDPYHFGMINEYKSIKESLENEMNALVSESEDIHNKRDYFQGVKDYIERFQLLFFIDCREQKDFRVFNVKYDEMTWSDRKFIDFNTKSTSGSNDNGFSVNIGFSGENDGVYEQKLYICLSDHANAENDDPGEAYPIGEILMCAETEGEDERYRAFFDNFGIPDPKYYNDIFMDSDINNDTPDYISINKHSKKMFLTYSDIFPYIGSYKGLLNAIKTLGYENEIFFKEWYKEIGNSVVDDNGYVTYEISFDDTHNKNVISNVDLIERIHLRKMNWVSMVYKINEELDKPEDKWGFPQTITNYKNFNVDRLAKILSLKDWLEKYAIGVNCHITDVGGEGLVFERYNLQKYGTYQKVIEYDNQKAISAVVQQEYITLDDGSANITVDIHTSDKDVAIEELYGLSFIDYLDGYFDDNNTYHDSNIDVIDSSKYIYFGKCFDLHDNINSLEIRTRGEHSSYKFPDYFTDYNSPQLIIDNDSILFDYYQCFKKYKNSAFLVTPVIQIENGVIKKFSKENENKGEKDYYANISPYIENGTTYYRIDIKKSEWDDPETTYDILEVPTLIPPKVTEFDTDYVYMDPISYVSGIEQTSIKHSNSKYNSDSYYQESETTHGLRYCTDNINNIPCFKIIGYEEKHMLFSDDHIRFPYTPTADSADENPGVEYMIEIINGRMIFNDTTNNSVITLNFVYDDSEKHQRIYVNTFKESEMSSMYRYKISENETTNRFLPSQQYNYFVNGYNNNVDDYISYDGTKSVNVNNAGEYVIDVVLYDEFNNIFAKRSSNKVNILPQYADASIFGPEINSGAPYNKIGEIASSSILSNVLSIFNDPSYGVSECVFEHSPKLQISNVNGNNLTYYGKQTVYDGTDDTGTNIIENEKISSKLILSSMSDRYDIVSEYNKQHIAPSKIFKLVKTSGYYGHLGVYDSSSIQNILNQYGTSISTIERDLDLLYNKSISEDNGSFADATLYVYDEVCEYPILSVPGVMIPGKPYHTQPEPIYNEYFDLSNVSYSRSGADWTVSLGDEHDTTLVQHSSYSSGGFYVSEQLATDDTFTTFEKSFQSGIYYALPYTHKYMCTTVASPVSTFFEVYDLSNVDHVDMVVQICSMSRSVDNITINGHNLMSYINEQYGTDWRNTVTWKSHAFTCYTGNTYKSVTWSHCTRLELTNIPVTILTNMTKSGYNTGFTGSDTWGAQIMYNFKFVKSGKSKSRYDYYYFMPTESSKTDASTLSDKLNTYCSSEDSGRFSYYIIPQWAIPCKINLISQENNIVDIELDNHIFSRELYKKYNLKEGRIATLFHNTNCANYFGKGSYMIKKVQSDSKYTLYAYIGKKRKGETEQYGFDCSTWFGTPSLDYMKYICDVDEETSDNQSNSINITNNISYKQSKNFIDQNYAISLRNFDPDDAIELWEYNPDDYPLYYYIKGKYIHTTPITVTQPYIEIIPHIPGYINNIGRIKTANITVRWKIYKKTGSMSRKLIMECFNKVLFLKLKEYGTYDIEMTLWDQYGNKFEKNMNGYLTYIKPINKSTKEYKKRWIL